MTAECDRSGCATAATVRVQFRAHTPSGHGRWWYYCGEHAWPLDVETMTWGARGKRARPMPVADVEWLR